jgi:hypothetical protein
VFWITSLHDRPEYERGPKRRREGLDAAHEAKAGTL